MNYPHCTWYFKYSVGFCNHNLYQEVVHEEVEYLAPKDILANLAKLEVEIRQGMEKLVKLLK